MSSTESAVAIGVVVALWFVREVIPMLIRNLRQAAQGDVGARELRADASGSHPAIIPPEQLATARELREVQQEVHRLAVAVGRLEERIARALPQK